MEKLIMIIAVPWWTLLVGIVIHMIFGMLWYGPFFGAQWMKALKITEQQIREAGGMGPGLYLSSMLTALVSTYVLGIVLNAANTQSIAGAIGIALVGWLGFFVAPVFNHSLFENSPKQLIAIHGSYHLVSLVIMAIIFQLAR